MIDLWTYRASLIRVVDGDNVVLHIDEGFRNTTDQSIRLVGVNAPELFSGDNRKAGAHAKAELQKWMWEREQEATDKDWPWLVRTLKDKQTFGRYLGYVTDEHGNSLNDWLISQPWQEDKA